MRTCAQLGVPPLPYLTDELRTLRDDVSVTDQLPDRWHEVYGAQERPSSTPVGAVRRATALVVTRIGGASRNDAAATR